MTNLYSVDNQVEKLHRHDGLSTTITSSIASNDNNPRGVAWDGSAAYESSGAAAEKQTQFSGFTVSVSHSFANPNTNCKGCSLEGANYLMGSTGGANSGHIVRCVGFSDSDLTDSIASGNNKLRGLTWADEVVGDNLIHSTSTADKIEFHSGFSETITSSITAPSTAPTGLAWNDPNLISTDENSNLVNLHAGFSTSITSTFANTGSNSAGLHWHLDVAAAPADIGWLVSVMHRTRPVY